MDRSCPIVCDRVELWPILESESGLGGRHAAQMRTQDQGSDRNWSCLYLDASRVPRRRGIDRTSRCGSRRSIERSTSFQRPTVATGTSTITSRRYWRLSTSCRCRTTSRLATSRVRGGRFKTVCSVLLRPEPGHSNRKPPPCLAALGEVFWKGVRRWSFVVGCSVSDTCRFLSTGVVSCRLHLRGDRMLLPPPESRSARRANLCVHLEPVVQP